MSRKGWKAVERSAAALCRAQRFPANMGGRLDFEGATYVGQCKNVSSLSLAALEALALEMERVGAQKQKLGVVIVKRSAGMQRDAQGRVVATPHLVVCTEAVWRELNGRMPTDNDRRLAEPAPLPRRDDAAPPGGHR